MDICDVSQTVLNTFILALVSISFFRKMLNFEKNTDSKTNKYYWVLICFTYFQFLCWHPLIPNQCETHWFGINLQICRFRKCRWTNSDNNLKKPFSKFRLPTPKLPIMAPGSKRQINYQWGGFPKRYVFCFIQYAFVFSYFCIFSV